MFVRRRRVASDRFADRPWVEPPPFIPPLELSAAERLVASELLQSVGSSGALLLSNLHGKVELRLQEYVDTLNSLEARGLLRRVREEEGYAIYPDSAELSSALAGPPLPAVAELGNRSRPSALA